MQSARQPAVVDAFIAHAEQSAELGSPFVSRLCRLFAERLDSQSKLAQALASVPNDADLSLGAYPLRVIGALHALVLQGKAAELQPWFPPQVEGIQDDELWSVVDGSISGNWPFVLSRLAHPPQTNEVRRAAILLPGFLTIARLFGLPLKLSEIGASAGLNLCWDSFRYRLGSCSWGDQSSEVRLEPDWTGGDPPDVPGIEIVERSGCDRLPLDPDNPDDRLKLLSFVWADQSERISRLKAAMRIARDVGAEVEKDDAIDWMGRRLREAVPNVVHVIYHSSVWMYFDSESHARGVELLENAGKRSTPRSPLAWLKFEPDGGSPGGGLVLQVWPTGERQTIARADFHGRWIDWSGWKG